MRATWVIYKHSETWVSMAVAAHRLGLHEKTLSFWKEALTVEAALFDSHPERRVLWAESRRDSGGVGKAVSRVAKRSDANAATIVLDEVLDSGDAVEAQSAIVKTPDWNLMAPLRLANAALDLLLEVD